MLEVYIILPPSEGYCQSSCISWPDVFQRLVSVKCPGTAEGLTGGGMRCFPPQLPPVSRYLLLGGQGRHQGAHSPPHLYYSGFSGGSAGKESACSVGDPGLIPGLGRSSGEGNGNPLQSSCLENLMYRGHWWAMAHGVVRIRHNLGLNLGHYLAPLQCLETRFHASGLNVEG